MGSPGREDRGNRLARERAYRSGVLSAAGAIGFYWSRSHAPVEGTRMARRKANKKTGSSRKSEGPLPVSRLPASVRSLRADQRHLPFRHRLPAPPSGTAFRHRLPAPPSTAALAA
jgi:hypothetical protein